MVEKLSDLFYTFSEEKITKPEWKKANTLISGGSQLYLHILENEDGLEPCGVISYRRDSYLKGDLDTSSWSTVIAGDVFALKGCPYMSEAYTNPFTTDNNYNPIEVHNTESGRRSGTRYLGDFDEYFEVTSDTVYKINEDGTVTRV